MKIAIKKIKIRDLIFEIKVEDHDHVLGQLFLNSVKFSPEYKPDEIFGTIAPLYMH